MSTLSRVKSVFMSMRACRVSLYTVPRKFSGIESWKSRPFTITRSPTVMLPAGRRRQSTQNVGLAHMDKNITTSFFPYQTISIFVMRSRKTRGTFSGKLSNFQISLNNYSITIINNSIRAAESLAIFKKQLKTHLFHLYLTL